MTTPYWQGENVTLHHGDCIEVMAAMPANSIDAIVCDPPYGLEFMGKDWDAPWKASSVGRGARVATERAAEMTADGKGHTTSAGPYLAARVDSVRVAGAPFQAWCLQWATEALRVLKPGGHLLAFGGTRTWHRLAVAIEDGGFEIRDSIAWLYGSGFPKSLDVSKAIDKAAGAQRVVTGSKIGQPGYSLAPSTGGNLYAGSFGGTGDPLKESQITAPATEAAQQWAGWGTALKPAFEPIVFARKPLVGTVAANVLAHGTGALNIDGCRIGTNDDLNGGTYLGTRSSGSAQVPGNGIGREFVQPSGRWPANVVLDADQAATLNQQSGTLTSGSNPTRRGADTNRDAYGEFAGQAECEAPRGLDIGGASRFFYVAKAPTVERPKQGGIAHPTVKPIDLMQWLVRLVTPPGGVVLDPFAGSGTTGEAAVREGFASILIEREADYLPLIRERFQRPINYILDFGDPA